MFGMRVTIKGEVRLTRAFRSLQEAAVHAGLRTGVLAAARVIRDEAANRVPKRTGLAARHMVAEIYEDRKGQGIVVAAVGPHKRKGWYVLFHEIGFRSHPPTPWLRPALDAKQAEAVETLRRAYWDNLHRVAAGLGALRGE